MKICPNCKALYHDDGLTTCTAKTSRNVPGAVCLGALREIHCLLCYERGWVELQDGTKIHCPRGCVSGNS
jgi:hypothetical protein